MIGGTIVQVVHQFDFTYVEVLDESHFERSWRRMNSGADVCTGDSLWWQSFTGYRTRKSGERDVNVGLCKPSCAPWKAKEVGRG